MLIGFVCLLEQVIACVCVCRARQLMKDGDPWLHAADVKDPKERIKLRTQRFEYDRSRRLEMALLWNRFDVAKYVMLLWLSGGQG